MGTVIIEGYSNSTSDIFLDNQISPIPTNSTIIFDGYTECNGDITFEGTKSVKFTSGGFASTISIDTDNGCEFNDGFYTLVGFMISSTQSTSVLCGYFNSSTISVSNSIIIECN